VRLDGPKPRRRRGARESGSRNWKRRERRRLAPSKRRSARSAPPLPARTRHLALPRPRGGRASYTADPVPGADIWVANALQGTRLRLQCVVPGIQFLEGTRPEFTAQYDPLTRRVHRIRRLYLRAADNATGEREPFEEPRLALLHQDGNLLSLAQLLRALQHYALAMNSTTTTTEADRKVRQLELRTVAFDETGNFRRSAEFVTLEQSQNRLSLFTQQPTADGWEFQDGCAVYPRLDPSRNYGSAERFQRQ